MYSVFVLFILFLSFTSGKCIITQKNPRCLDLEMFEQCLRAQQILDDFTKRVNYNTITLECYKNLYCLRYPPTASQYWCQNVDSYQLCVSAKNAIKKDSSSLKNLFQILCYKEAPLDINGVPVIDYYEDLPIEGPPLPLVLNFTKFVTSVGPIIFVNNCLFLLLLLIFLN